MAPAKERWLLLPLFPARVPSTNGLPPSEILGRHRFFLGRRRGGERRPQSKTGRAKREGAPMHVYCMCTLQTPLWSRELPTSKLFLEWPDWNCWWMEEREGGTPSSSRHDPTMTMWRWHHGSLKTLSSHVQLPHRGEAEKQQHWKRSPLTHNSILPVCVFYDSSLYSQSQSLHFRRRWGNSTDRKKALLHSPLCTTVHPSIIHLWPHFESDFFARRLVSAFSDFSS